MRKRSGFTLIEVLVVVSIIALLASILLPSLSGARRSAKLAKCQHNLHQIGVAMEAYMSRSKDYFPFICRMLSQEMEDHNLGNDDYDDLEASDFPDDFDHPLPKVLERDVSKNTELFECPEDYVDPEQTQQYLQGGLSISGRYFDSEKTSYEWNDILSDRKYPRRRRHRMIQLCTGAVDGTVVIYARMRPCDTMMINDMDEFHSGNTGVRNAFNILYADMSVRLIQ